MKRTCLIYFFISLFANQTFSQRTVNEKDFSGSGSQMDWIWQNPYPQGNDLFSVKFIGSTGWAAGDYGTIIRTTNNGSNWSIQKSNTNEKLNSIFCVDQFNVWIAGNNGVLIKTSNGGYNWSQQVTGSAENFYSVTFVNSLTGWAVGDTNVVFKTTNGGISWITESIGTNDNAFYSVLFINADTGWVTGSEGTILRTINGGENWNIQLTSTPLFSIKMHNGSLFASGYGFHKSTNFGNNWINIPLNMTEPILAFDFVNSDTGYGVGGFAGFVVTTNGGNNWNFLFGPYGFKTSICFQGDSGHFVGEDGIIYSSTNGGINWSSQSNNLFYTLQSVFFANSLIGWAVGSSCSGCNDGVMLKTTDGGNNWIDRSDAVSTTFHDVFFIDQNTGWTCGYEERIMKTTNGGDNWFVQYLSINGSITSIYFYDHNTGWASGRAKVLRTTDGGNNWIRHTGLIGDLMTLHFINQNTGWVVGEYGGAFKTTNGGLNWSQKMVGTTSWLSSIFFISPSTGWITGAGATLLKTTNGGENWVGQLPPLPPFNLSGISFANENEGFAVGHDQNDHAVIIHTTSGGTTWEHSDNGPSSSLYEIFHNSSSGSFYTVGDNGTILRSEDSIITNVHQNLSSVIPERFYLGQNFPNPFNPITNLEFGIPESGFVTLKIYDVLGNEVATLVNENKTAGSHSVNFDGSKLASGVYYYRIAVHPSSGAFASDKLTAGDFSDTKRMVLVK